MTAHNSFFGWVHCFGWSNGLLSSTGEIYDTPYPPLQPNPTLKQAIRNWNLADTGMAVSLTLFAMLFAARHNRLDSSFLFQQRKNYRVWVAMSAAVGVLLGLRNSVYRLEGLVPNGLAPYEVEEPVKYNYRGPFLEKSILKPLFSEQKKPSA